MPSFGTRSRRRLDTCDPRLQQVFNAVVRHFDCTILKGHRPEDEQNQAVADEKSQLPWPQGKHNGVPSKATDAAPYPIDWEDRERFTYFAGFVKGIALGMGFELRWGGDWNGDWQVRDNSFDDLVHFELVEG